MWHIPVDQGSETHSKNVLLITFRRYNGLESELGRVEGSVHPYVDPFSAVHLQMRAKMSQSDLPSLSCRIMNSLRPTVPHMLNFCLWNHIPANLFPPLVLSLELTITTTSTQTPGGQELGSILPLQTQLLMARNSSRKSCRLNCMCLAGTAECSGRPR